MTVAKRRASSQTLRLPAPELARPQAPVLALPRTFEPSSAENRPPTGVRQGGEDSGFMLDVNGRDQAIIDHGHKRRRDYEIEDEMPRRACRCAYTTG
jgi:hypothetical protein